MTVPLTDPRAPQAIPAGQRGCSPSVPLTDPLLPRYIKAGSGERWELARSPEHLAVVR